MCMVPERRKLVKFCKKMGDCDRNERSDEDQFPIFQNLTNFIAKGGIGEY